MLDDRPELHALLLSYVRAAEASESPEDGRWTSRVGKVRDVEPQDLPALQGEAIALGFLEVDLADPNEGLKYRVPARIANRIAA